MRREDLYDVTVEVQGTDGTIRNYLMDKSTAIATKAKDTKYRPANGLESEISLGGPRSNENGTFTRLYDNELRKGEGATINSTIHWLIGQAGRARVVIKKQPLDENGHPFGEALIYTGKLVDVTPPPTDSESDKPALIEFMCSFETNVG